MANNDQNIQAIAFKPNLAMLLDYVQKNVKIDTVCHHVGTVQTFYPEDQTADVTVNYTKTFQQIDGVGNINVVAQPYPMLVKCPVIFLGGGQGAITFPVTEGDECLILFGDRDFSLWQIGQNGSVPNTGRLHSISDAIVLVGLRSMPRAITDFDTDGLAIRYGDNKVKVTESDATIVVGGTTVTVNSGGMTVAAGSSTFAISSDGTISFNNGVELIATLLDMFRALTLATAGGFPLIIPPAYTTAYNNLATMEA